MTTGTITAVSPKIVEMSVTPASVDVEPGDTLEFTNNSAQFPTFEVVFLHSSPNDSGLIFPGIDKIEVLVTKEGKFDYRILHFSPGKPQVDIGTFSVRSCAGGCP
jgi:plastocyanin